jgi:diguanylate cyclase (GGDEF)-like protein/PAS domain S-box-containing protein
MRAAPAGSTERKIAEEAEKRLARAFQLLSKCDSLLVHAEQEQELLAAVCRLAVEAGGYLMAWVGAAQHDAARTVRPLAWSGFEDGYLESVNLSWGSSERGMGPTGTAIRTGSTVVIQDFLTNPLTALWRDAARRRGYQSSISLPLINRQGVIGAFCVYAADAFAFGPEEVKLLEQLANDLAYGMQTLRSRDEHEAARIVLKRESEKNVALLRNASDGIHILDADGNAIEVSDSFCSMLGYTRDEMLGMNVARWDAKLAGGELKENLRRQFERQVRSLFETRHRRKDGSTFDVEISGYPLEFDGRPVLFNSSRDITERKRAEDSLRESEMRLRAIIEQSPVGMAFSRDGITINVNAAYLEMFGYAHAAEVCGRPLLEQIAPQCRAEVEDRYRRRVASDTEPSDYESVGLRADGSQFPMHITAKRLSLKDGPLTLAFLVDITRQRASEDEIRRLAFFDQLTDLPNRRLLLDRLQHAQATSARNRRHGALLFIDLDNFKSLNDTLGHSVGDALLRQVALRLRAHVREGDSVARLGGDEFVVILEDLGGDLIEAAQQTEIVANKLLAALNPPYWLASSECHCTASVGATLFSGHAQSKDELLKQADIAMYQAKKAGRNGVRFFDPRMQEAINAQAALEGELRQALEKQQFHLHYQVQVDSAGRPFGAEALLRWVHPERGLVSPLQFIPLAEETDLIVPIGQWVLEAACAQLEAWERDPATRALSLCVNVSPKQFHRVDFVQSVLAALQRHAIAPALLTLELTESLLLDNVAETVATMNALGRIGVRFSLDDFGTGYSSLQYLKRLPLHQLKIDQSFVHDIAVDGSDLAIVQTIIAMARSLNLGVIAEGVETEEQRQLLISRGCNEFQGYLFGRPVPVEQFEAALRLQVASAVGA